MPDELRRWSPDDAPALRDASASSPDLVPQFGGKTLTSVEQAKHFIIHQLVFTEECRNWAIVVDGVAVGSVGLAAIEWLHETAWAYYWLTSVARGRGHAGRALTAASAWALDQGLFRLELGHRINNPASCKGATRAATSLKGSNVKSCTTERSGTASRPTHAYAQMPRQTSRESH